MRRKMYFGVKARIIVTLAGLVFTILALLAGTSFALGRNVLLGMLKSNLDTTTGTKQIQTYEQMTRMLWSTMHLSQLPTIQNILNAPDDENFRSEQKALLAQSMAGNWLMSISTYLPNGELVHADYAGGYSQAAFPSELLPIEFDNGSNTTTMEKLYTSGGSVAGPVNTANLTGSHLMSITVIVRETRPVINYQDVSSLTDSSIPALGFLTCVFACDDIRALLDRSSDDPLEQGVSSGNLGVLENTSSYKVLLPGLFETVRVYDNMSLPLPHAMWRDLNAGKQPEAQLLDGHLVSASPFTIVDQQYVVVVYQSHKGVFAMIESLGHTLAIATCCTAAGILVLIVLITILGVRPLAKLQYATKNRQKLEPRDTKSGPPSPSTEVASSASGHSSRAGLLSGPDGIKVTNGSDNSSGDNAFESTPSISSSALPHSSHVVGRKRSRWLPVWALAVPELLSEHLGLRSADAHSATEHQRLSIKEHESASVEKGVFEVPPKVTLSRQHLRDELDNITMRFNSMSEALQIQYRILEDRVDTRKREIEDARRMADEANAAKSHFLARVTHELRTPLNGILGTATLCMDEESLPEIRSSLKTVFKCGELLLHLLTDLLTFSQNEIDNLVLEEREFMVNEVTSQLTAVFREQSSTAGVRLKIEADPDCAGLIMYGDINRILQVVFNLMSNSLKFTPPGGEVSFRVLAESFGNSDVRQVTFSVNDTGPGIAPHLQSRIFEAFVQGDINTKVRKAGVGLGLSICRQLAERMGGTISLHSELGKGSEFRFALPLRYVSRRRSTHSLDEGNKDEFWPEYELWSADTIRKRAENDLETGTKLIPTTPGGHSNASSDKYPFPTVGEPAKASEGSTSGSSPGGTGTSASEMGSAKAALKSPKLLSTPKVWGLDQRPEMHRHLSSEAVTLPDMRVLVTDDNKVNQEVMVRMLNLEGLKDIQVANDGAEAIEKVKEAIKEARPYDIIFMDVQMPVIDGRKATQILRTEHNFTAPIVAVSAFANEENVQECLEVGMSVFLAKPLRRPSLRKLLQSIVSTA